MVTISVLVRFWQEYRSSIAVFRLQSSVTCDLKVRRQHAKAGSLKLLGESSEKIVTEKELVPGDVVVLSPGSVVPADCLILEATFLRVSQSTWTGESEPVVKTMCSAGEKESIVFDLSNIAFMGTSVVSGHGLALVLRTGSGK